MGIKGLPALLFLPGNRPVVEDQDIPRLASHHRMMKVVYKMIGQGYERWVNRQTRIENEND